MLFSAWLFLGITAFAVQDEGELIKTNHLKPLEKNAAITHARFRLTNEISYISTENNVVSFVDGNKKHQFSLEAPPVCFKSDQAGNFAAVLTKSIEIQKNGGLVLHFLNNKQKRHHSVFIDHVYGEQFPELAVNNAGEILLAKTTLNRIFIFTADGHLQNQIDLFEANDFAHERNLRIIFAPDGESFYAAAMREPARPENPGLHRNVILKKMDMRGNEDWHTFLPEQALGELQLSSNGEKLAIYTYDAYSPAGIVKATRIFNSGGELISELDAGFRSADFSKDGDNILFFEKREAMLYSIATNKISATAVVQSPEMIVATILHAANLSFTVLTGTTVFEKNEFTFQGNKLWHYSPNGSLISQSNVPETLSESARLLHTESPRSFILMDKNAVQIYSVGAEK
ncbi:MAG: hypothetical protein DWQ05_14785 [Calditrichaeota bacterium]|nr:MAG: hypothetical protein DWQ05_14785 [Calditrichota bacterium]